LRAKILLYIQDSSFSQSYSLHEALIRSCSNSVSGYGAYAFASASGVELLFTDSEFESLLDRGTYSVIIGIDEITNTSCIEKLNELKEKHSSLNVKAFLHNQRGSLFHPKISYFRNLSGDGALIVGSGNLTIGGLRANREAFSAITLSKEELDKIDSYWQSWLTESNHLLKDTGDPDVLRKVEENRLKSARNNNPPTATIIGEDVQGEPDSESSDEQPVGEGWEFYRHNNVLLAEIPKSGDRWKQANFDVTTFKDFFGATPGDNSQRILLRNINYDMSLGGIEVRPSVSVKSQNYRFELDAATGLPYPAVGKPIGVFIQLTTRMFLYHLFMPGENNHAELADWMSSHWHGRADRMKRLTTTVSELESIISHTVLRKYLAE
jgi:HKD family nuclease